MQQEKPRIRVKAGSQKLDLEKRNTPKAGYLRGEPGFAQSIGLFKGTPALRDRADDISVAWYAANARANDATMNSGWIAGVVEQIVTSMIGSGLRLNAKPDLTFLKWNEKEASDWARLVETRWEIWASQPYECDLAGRYTMAQLEAAAIRQWIATGEILAQVKEVNREGAQSLTKVRLMPSHWLSQKNSASQDLQDGVYTNKDGLPIAYAFKVKDGYGVEREERREARDQYGRPRIIHIFDGSAGQLRGITPLAPALKIVRQYDQLADATLTAAMIHAIFAATIESDYPTNEVMQALQGEAEITEVGEDALDVLLDKKMAWYENVNIDLGRHGKIAHLLTGEKLKLHASEHPNSTYEAFSNFLLREVAACLGVMPSDLTGDFRGDTYSSVRMGIAKKWPLMEYRRRHLPGRFAQTVYSAWLEEEIDAGRIPLPGGIDTFVKNRTALTRSDWRGPPKPQADDYKAARAHETWYKMGVISQEMICNDLGVDHEDVHEQLAREKASRINKGLSEPLTNNTAPSLVDEIED